MLTLSKKVTENNFPDCVAMELHIGELKTNTSKSPFSTFTQRIQHEAKVSKSRYSLSLTINFSGEQEVEIPGLKYLGILKGRATFGIRKGKLTINLSGCKMPLNEVIFNAPLPIVVNTQFQQQQTTNGQVSFSVGLADGVSLKTSGQVGNQKSESSSGSVSKVHKIGGPEKPGWVFEAITRGHILKGGLQNQTLGILHIYPETSSCEIEATFTVHSSDVILTWGEMGRAKDISRNKLALIERAITKNYIAPQLQPLLCLERFHSG